jgi:hypothetical protein
MSEGAFAPFETLDEARVGIFTDFGPLPTEVQLSGNSIPPD